MALSLLTPPALEPVSLAEAKAHLRIDAADEDAVLSRVIAAAREHLERSLGRALLAQSWRYTLDAWPSGYAVGLPLAPVQSVDSVKVYAQDDSSTTLPVGSYLLDGLGAPARLIRRGAQAWPAATRAGNGVEINFTAGHGSAPTDVPAALRVALLLLAAHWFEHREVVEPQGAVAPMPMMVADLIGPYRVRHL